MNEEFQVNARHQRALITSLPFVHTARRYPGLSCFEKSTDQQVGLVLLAGKWLNRNGLNRVKVVTRYQ
jgi:hypothetical protein